MTPLWLSWRRLTILANKGEEATPSPLWRLCGNHWEVRDHLPLPAIIDHESPTWRSEGPLQEAYMMSFIWVPGAISDYHIASLGTVDSV